MDVYISNDKTLLDIPLIHQYLSVESYWAKGRSLETIKTTIENSMCFGVYNEQQQVGFARVVSDRAIFAWIMDVFILPDFQGNGLGKKLMANIMSHPELQNLSRWGLGTLDAHGLYKQFGFSPIADTNRLMEIKNYKDV